MKIDYLEKNYEMGCLSSIGMDKKQIREMLLKEGMILGTIGIVIGLIIGIIFSYGINIILQKIINNLQYFNFTYGKINIFNQIQNNVKFEMHIPSNLIILSIAISYIIVFATILYSNKKIKPVKSKYKHNINKNQLTFSKKGSQERILAFKYIKFESSRYRMLIASLTISILIFLIITGVTSTLNQNYNKLAYNDYCFSASSEKSKEVIEVLEKENLIKSYYSNSLAFTNHSSILTEVPENKLSSSVKKMLKEGSIKEETPLGYKNINETYTYTILPYYYTGEAYKSYLEQIGKEELKENECIIVNTRELNNSKYGDSHELTNYQVRRYFKYYI